MKRTIVAAAGIFSLGLLFAQEQGEDTSAGLPSVYGDYLIAASTVSPDKKIAVIYPTGDLCEEEPTKGAENRCRDFLVALEPFKILTALETKWPYFQHESHGGLTAAWSQDGSAVLVTLDSKWGPGEIFLYEIRDAKLTRATDLLGKVRALLEPDFKKTKAPPYNDYFHFIFDAEDETPVAEFVDLTHVRIHAFATTEPKGIAGLKVWEATAEATWDVAQGKFSSQKVTRKFAGVRKGGDD